MELKEILGSIAVILTLTSGIIYYISIFKGKTQPHLYTRLVWVIVESIIFFGQVVSGGGAGSWMTGFAAFTTLGIVILSFWYGTKDITKSDKIMLILALLSIIPWIIFKDPIVSVFFAILIDIWAIIPTFRKTWNNPLSESLTAWLLGDLKFICAFFALSIYSFTTWIYPVEAFLMNTILIFIIIHRRKVKEDKKV